MWSGQRETKKNCEEDDKREADPIHERNGTQVGAAERVDENISSDTISDKEWIMDELDKSFSLLPGDQELQINNDLISKILHEANTSTNENESASASSTSVSTVKTSSPAEK